MGLEKLTIKAYKKPDFSEPSAGEFEVLINPESFREDTEISYNGEGAIGSSAGELTFKEIPAKKVSFKLVFDGTGLITNPPQSLKNKLHSVEDQINAFKKVTALYEGDIHRPYYLELSWGNYIFKGVLTSLTINYKLFNPDGSPLRADADVSFSSTLSAREKKAEAKEKSPDVTHVVQFRAGDRLPALCERVYRDPNYFVQVARQNQLNSIRRIRKGTELIFPAVAKK